MSKMWMYKYWYDKQKVVTGGVLFGGVGAVVGGVTSKKLFNVCQCCGYRWQPGKK